MGHAGKVPFLRAVITDVRMPQAFAWLTSMHCDYTSTTNCSTVYKQSRLPVEASRTPGQNQETAYRRKMMTTPTIPPAFLPSLQYSYFPSAESLKHYYTAMSNPHSMFTIDNILAPRPMVPHAARAAPYTLHTSMSPGHLSPFARHPTDFFSGKCNTRLVFICCV